MVNIQYAAHREAGNLHPPGENGLGALIDVKIELYYFSILLKGYLVAKVLH